MNREILFRGFNEDPDDIKLFNYMKELMLSIYKDLLERIKNNNYENSKN